MKYSEKAIKILGDSLAQHKQAIKAIQTSLTENKNLHSKEAIQLKTDMVKQLSEIDTTMRSHIESLPIPKDGKDAEVDYKSIFEFVTKEVLKVEPEKVDYSKIDSKVESEVSKIPPAKNGAPGKDAVNGKDGVSPQIDYAKVNKGVMSQFPKKAIIEDVKKQIPKPEVVVGIEELKLEGDNLIIITTDGKKKKFPISFKTMQLFGNGGSFNEILLQELVITTTENKELTEVQQTILCDATDGDIDIKLPDPAKSSRSSRSIRIAVSKKDSSLHKVNIIPFGSETITGEATVQLLRQNEIWNFITDGTNWWLGA